MGIYNQSNDDPRGKIKIYNARDGCLLHKLSVPNETHATSLDFQGGGQKLASGHGRQWYRGLFPAHYKPLSIYIWDPVKGDILQKIAVSLYQTGLRIDQLHFHHETLWFLRCGNPYKGNSEPGFMAMNLNGSILFDINGLFSDLRQNPHWPGRIVLKNANEFKALDTTKYSTVKKIKRTKGINDVSCVNDGAIIVLHDNGKIETYKDDVVTSQQLMLSAFRAEDTTQTIRYRGIGFAPGGSIIIFARSSGRGIYIISLKDRSCKKLKPDGWNSIALSLQYHLVCECFVIAEQRTERDGVLHSFRVLDFEK